MTVRHKLLESMAERSRYCFVNSAQQTRIETSECRSDCVSCKDVMMGDAHGCSCHTKWQEEKGVHISVEKIGDSKKKMNIFLSTEDALKLFIGLRDSLRHVITETNENEKQFLRIQTERDSWGMARYNGLKSHVAEDLGL